MPNSPNAVLDASLAPAGWMDLALAQFVVWMPGEVGAEHYQRAAQTLAVAVQRSEGIALANGFYTRRALPEGGSLLPSSALCTLTGRCALPLMRPTWREASVASWMALWTWYEGRGCFASMETFGDGSMKLTWHAEGGMPRTS